jgi:ribosome-binding factor A
VSRRTDQVGEAIREEIAGLVARGLKDPRIGFVTITRAQVTSDLRQARIFFGVLGDEKQKEKTLAGLQQAAGFIRHELGKRLRLRFLPDLIFQYDVGLEATDRVARLLDETRAASEGDESDAKPDSDSDSE